MVKRLQDRTMAELYAIAEQELWYCESCGRLRTDIVWREDTEQYECRECRGYYLEHAKHTPNEKLIAGYFNFSPVTGISDDEMCEPFFSRFACETCGSTLGGNRHYCSATIGKAHTNPREKFEVCVDCFEYFFT